MAGQGERSLTSCFPAGDQTLWADISPLIEAVSIELQVGELIHGENFSLFEAMSALEIMDPKMDAGITTCGFHSLEEAIESNAAPINLSVLETINVMDHLLACEATWHKGHSLAQTVFSCLYLLDVERTSPNPLLHSYCRTVRATCELIRSAVSDSRTHEEEDFFTLAFGLVLKKEGDEKCLSMLNAVEETLSRQLRACKNSVSKKKLTEDFEPLQSNPELEGEYCKAVLCRLRFRKAFYHALTYMGKPQGRGLEMAHKHIRSGLIELAGIRESSIFLSSISGNTCKVDGSTTASGQMAVGFDDSINRRLLAPTPPRSIEILNWKMAMDYFEKLLEDLDQICLMPLNLSIEEILQFTVDFQKSQPDLVARSRLQLLLVQDGKLFGRDLLSDVICRAINMPQLSNNLEFPKHYIVTQLGRLMLNLLRILCTNTAWQRRKLGKSLQEWGTLFHQLEVACNNQLESNSSSFEGKGLWMMQMMNWTGEQTCWMAARYLLLGFELELYSSSEYCMIYWYLVNSVLSTLLQLSQERLNVEKDQQRLALAAVDASKKKVKKKRGKEAEKEIHLPGMLLQQACSYLGEGLAWMLAALTNDHKYVDRPTAFNTEQEIFIQNFELLQNSRVPEPLSYIQFKQSTMHANFLMQFRRMDKCFEEALNVLKELRHCVPKGFRRLEEIRQMEHVAEKNRIALSVILAGKGDSLPRVSFEFSQHPCFPFAVIKRS